MKGLKYILSAMFAALLVVSCTGVQMEQFEDTFEVFPRVCWPDGERLDTSRFERNTTFTRIIGERHYIAPYWKWTQMQTGKYLIVSYAYPKGSYSVESLDRYAADNKFSLRNVTMNVPQYPLSEVNTHLGRYGRDALPDMAPDMPCVEQADTLLTGGKAASRTGEYRLPERLDSYSNSRGVLNDTLKIVSASVTVRVPVSVGSKVTVDEVVACITGVPSSLNLLTSSVRRSNSGKVWVNMEPNGAGSYTTTIGCLGLIPPIGGSYTSGAGVLHLYITASAGDVRRTFVLSHNMKKEIDANPVLQSVDADNMYRIVNRNVTYVIDSPLKIYESNILYGEMDNLFDWTDGGSFIGNDDQKPVY